MSKKIVFALSLFALLCSLLYVRFNSLQAKCSNGYAVAPLFTLTDIEGNIVALENLTGKIVVLDFFYPQCQYSDDQIVHLEEIYEKYTRDELEIISISPKEIPIQDLEEFKTGPNRFSDLEYEISCTIARDIETQNVTAKYNILGYPTTVIIDQDGYTRYRHVGLTEESVLRSEIESLLPKTIYVDDDNVSGPWNGTKEHPYQNITSGLEHASDNDIVFVQNGTYYEHVTVNKSISLIGENKSNTVIDGNGQYACIVHVVADDVVMGGFTMRNNRDYPGIYLENSSYCVISYNIFIDIPRYAIYTTGAEHCRIEANIFSSLNENWGRGIQLRYSDNSTIADNQIMTHNDQYCIWLHNSSGCKIYGNRLACGVDGLMIEHSYGCLVKKNLIENCERGIDIGWAVRGEFVGNLIRSNYYGVEGEGDEWIFYHNNFINNTHQAYVSAGEGGWNNTLEGNYWDDYTGTDSNHDGIGEVPYSIEHSPNTDNYPLMGMFSSFNATSKCHVQTICNSTISDFQFNGTAILLDVSGENGTAGFCRICVPKALMNETYRVLVNGTEILPAPLPLPCSNNTHTYLYFTYNHSTQEVIIIPEFPSFLIIPLFMMATLLKVIVYKRKHQTRNKKKV